MSVDYSAEDGVATIVINRPERKNAITVAMRSEIEDAFRRAQDDHEGRAIRFTGAGSDFMAASCSVVKPLVPYKASTSYVVPV